MLRYLKVRHLAVIEQVEVEFGPGFSQLRLVQDQLFNLARGGWSWVPYAIAMAFTVLVAVIAASRIRRLDKELP